MIPKIHLKITIDEKTGSAIFDFEGTGAEIRGNLNAPASVVHAAVIYSLRAMLDADIPLNAGCLVPIDGTSSSSLLFDLLLTKKNT
jgi:N-methylhydantoinase B/oxoprolinase/acetone carboxylase alpha subunit